MKTKTRIVQIINMPSGAWYLSKEIYDNEYEFTNFKQQRLVLTQDEVARIGGIQNKRVRTGKLLKLGL